MDPVTLTQQLIEKPSITPDDAGCLAFIADHLTAHGFVCHRFEVGGVTNLWARYGTSAPLICLLGHTDVVPPGDVSRWDTHPFTPTIRGDKLYGRGASDMKSAVAAMVEAACQVVTQHPTIPGSIGLIFTSDEEGPAVHGTKAVVEYLTTQQVRIDYCLVGEPSCEVQLGDTIKIGRRGSLTGKLTVIGQQGHVAYPHRARNPIHLALEGLYQLSQRVWDTGNAHFPPTSFQIAHLHSSAGAANVIPGELEAWFNFRFNPAHTPDELQQIVTHTFAGIPHRLQWQSPSLPFLTPPQSRLINALSESILQVTGLTPQHSTAGGTSDGRFLAPLGTEVAEFGVPNASIHQVNEHVLLKDIRQLTEVYAFTIKRVLNLMPTEP